MQDCQSQFGRQHGGRYASKPRIVHFGNDVAGPGGVASVIRQHLNRQISGLSDIASVATYFEGASRRANIGVFASAIKFVMSRPLTGVIAHIHVTHGGSLVREGALVWLTRLRRSKKVVVTVHGSSVSEARRWQRILYRVALRPAQQIHLLADSHRVAFRRGDRRLYVLPNDVALPAIGRLRRERCRRVVFLGQLSYRKGLDTLLSAWRALENHGWVLSVAGEEVEESKAIMAGSPRNVECLGFLSKAEVSALLSGAAVLVLPSRAEAMPMAVCEAMAHGCAVVTTDVGGVRALLGDSAMSQIVRAGDSIALRDALQELLDSEHTRLELGRRNRNRAEEIFGEGISRKWAKVYGVVF